MQDVSVADPGGVEGAATPFHENYGTDPNPIGHNRAHYKPTPQQKRGHACNREHDWSACTLEHAVVLTVLRAHASMI